jgi:hypothetical protein
MVVNGKDWMFPSLGLVGISWILGAVEKIDRVPGVPLVPCRFFLPISNFQNSEGLRIPYPSKMAVHRHDLRKDGFAFLRPRPSIRESSGNDTYNDSVPSARRFA